MSILMQYIDVEVPDDFRRDYSRTMSNWSYLSFYLSSREPTAEIVGRLIKMEMDGKKREQIVYRLVQRLGSIIRRQIRQEMEDLVNARKNSREVLQSEG